MDTTTSSAPTILAEPFAGGFYAGRINVAGVVYALIVAPKDVGEQDDVQWNKSLKAIDGARSFFDGRANTEAMAEAGSKVAKWALGLEIGGYSDWYLPSRDELELAYRAFKPTNDENYCWRGDNPSSVPVGYAYSLDAPAQTTTPAFRDKGAEAFAPEWYWSSTQFAGGADYAWVQGFGYGGQDDDHKDYVFRARAVRRVAI